uniref:zinc ribbon domain-containing protein n=1 Tax=uncultured Eubacterium sp. TaxID=165185 RepID=UPI0025E00EFA
FQGSKDWLSKIQIKTQEQKKLYDKCGNIKKNLKLSERVYICSCGNRIDRDLNAAMNIREEARRMLLAG